MAHTLQKDEGFDVIVLGGGPGGYVAAIRAAQLGRKTAVIEKDKLGGTCLNRGCIPTKVLLQSAELYHSIENAKEFGITATADYHYDQFAARKEKITAQLRNGVKGLLKGAGVTLIEGEGVLQDAYHIKVGNDVIPAEQIILATGSAPAIPPVPGADQAFVHTSDSLLDLTECPDSITIIGGGVIGIEFATLYSRLGKQVTVIEMMPTILYGLDDDVVKTMERVIKGTGVKVYTSSRVMEIKEKEVLYITGEEQKSVKSDLVLIAAGRKPCTEGIGMDNAGIHIDEKGFIPVDSEMRTNIPNIYAIGDITGRIQLAHVASAQGLVAAHNAAGQRKTMKYDNIPACVYTSPEIAAVGLTEKAARENGYPVKIGTFPVAANGKSMITGEGQGFAKLITREDTGELLGAYIVAPHATDMIAEIVTAMQAEATVEELAEAVHPHPTVSEIIMEAAEDVSGLCIHKGK